MKYFAKTYVLSDEEAENIVQDVFTELWEKRTVLELHLNVVSYLFKATKNRCLNYLRHQTIVMETADELRKVQSMALEMSLNSLEALDMNEISDQEISKTVNRALDILPEKCRRIFIMNKFEGKKQKDIALLLDISINTVENQIAIAHRKLRNELQKYFLFFLFMLNL